MGHNCPHCKADLGEGFVDQTTLTSRLAAKQGQIDQLTTAAATEKAAREKAEREAREFASARDSAVKNFERTLALRDAGIAAPKKVSGISQAYDAYAAEAADKAKPFGDWLATDARSDEWLAPHFAQPAGQTAATQQAAGQADASAGKGAVGTPAANATNKLPDPNLGAKAVGPNLGKLTPAQAAAGFDQEYRERISKIPNREERKKAMAEAQTKYAQAVEGPPAA